MPIVGIPIFGDQPDNAARLKERGLGQTFFNSLTLLYTPSVWTSNRVKIGELSFSSGCSYKGLVLQIEMDVP